ncbi:MAG: leucine-rich repeat domain-containing protein [Faecalicoccus sp.]|nr:leucine-rich repeat domain-containing protein [Faecalicoccus sp.]
MSKRLVSVLAAMTVCAPAIPVSAQTAASIENVTKTQIQTAGDILLDVSDIVSNTIDSIEVEQQPEEVSYTYYEQPVYAPVVYYETPSYIQEPVVEVVSTQSIDDSYQIALAAYNEALAAYNAASQIIETTREDEVEITEEVTDEEGNVSTVTRTEMQTVTETSYAGDVEAARAALDAATAALNEAQANTQTEAVEETVVVDQQAATETALYAAAANQCGDNVTWTLSDMGVLNISGSGAMYDYTKDNHSPWYDSRLMVNEVVVNTGVTRIGNYAFDECKSISSVTLADTVTEIGQYAFTHEPGIVESVLTSIVIPDSVTKIEMYAFNYCDNLTAVEFGSGLTTIDKYAFNWCKRLKNLIFADGLTTIGVQAFYRCQSLETVELPSTVQTVGEGAFKECTSLKNVTLNDGLKTISASAFSGCTSLETIEIPGSVTSLGSNPFAKCPSLMNINVDASNTKYTSVDGIVYNKAKTTLVQCPIGKTAVTIPDTVTKIGNYAFYQCENLTSIDLPEIVTSIGSSAFYQCNGLKNVVLPNSVSTIGTSAFSMCRYLESVDLGTAVTSVPTQAFFTCDKMESIILPNTLTSIATDAFAKCSALKDVYYRGTEEDWMSKALYTFDNVTMHYMADYVISTAHALSLAGNVEVQFYMLFDQELLNDNNAKVVFEIDGNTISYKLTEGSPLQNYLRFTVPATSVQLASDIAARVFSSNGDIGFVEKYSAKDYCDYQLAKSTTKASLRTLLEALLNYGGHAQTFFKVNLDNLANKDLTDTDVSDVTVDDLASYASIKSGKEEGLIYGGSALVLDSMTTIKHYFLLEDGHSIQEYSFMLGDVSLTPIKSGSLYCIDIPNITSRDLDTLYTVTAGDFSIQYSALSYAYSQLKNEKSTAELKDVCRALYKYNQAANAYFG